MKLFALFFATALPAIGQSAIPVIDFSVLAQAIDQVSLAAEQLEQMKLELERLGDPAAIHPPPAIDLILALREMGESKTLDEIQAKADGLAALLYSGNGIYRVPGEFLRRADGTSVRRAVTAYRRFDAITQARNAQETVFADTEDRRQELRDQIRRTLRKLEEASTMAEVAKLHAILTAQNSELSTIDRERNAAAGRVLAQQVENQADSERQERARREERRIAFLQAQERLGALLTPETSLVTIPNPQRP